MADTTIISGVGGAVLGAIFTAGGTWWVSIRLDRQRENRRLMAGIGVVAAEIRDNAERIAKNEKLTLGDWDKNKATLAGLALRENDDLWKLLTRRQTEIFAAIQSGHDPPAAEAMRDLGKRLLGEHAVLAGEIQGFSSLRRARYRR